jgi:transcriptional regulator with XRE-family HTH domain
VPIGRPPKPLDPNASAAAALGAEIRARRTARGWTLQALSDEVGYSPQHVSDVELAKNPVSGHFVAAVDRALDADGRLLALWSAAVIERAFDRQARASARRGALRSPEEVDDVRRRAFIGLGLAVVLFGPEAASRASTDDWDRIAYEWSRELLVAPDRQALLPGLAADLKRLGAHGGPQRAIAQLSSYVAMIATSGGDVALAQRWWRRARLAADAHGDSHLTAYIAGQHAVHAHYGGEPVRALSLAAAAMSATSTPCPGRMHALSARSKALAVLGHKRDARAALDAAEAAFEQLPRDITREKISVGGWAEERLHHTRSYVAAFGGVGDGDSARDAALELYSLAAWRGPAQINLHRAAAETDAGYAATTLAALSDAQRSDRSVRWTAMRVLDTCERESGPGIAELREVLRVA